MTADPELIAALKGRIASIEAQGTADFASFNEDGRESASPFAAESTVDRGADKQVCARSAFERLVGLVNASDKSERTVRDRLGRAGFSEAEIEAAVERGRELGLIDDRRFGRLLVESRLRQGKGSVGIEEELKSHAIDPCSVEGWPEEFEVGFEAELERALQLLERRPPRAKDARAAAYRRVRQKGFPSSVATTAARLWHEKHPVS